MRAVDLIAAKRAGAHHSSGEIKWLIDSYVGGAVPDYQMAAWLMAVCFTGLSREETCALTSAMVESGETVDMSDIGGVVADKHSTGGVGDKVSMVLGPLVASCGVPFAKMSGRGLGHTGGTIDKLESIPGFRTELTIDEFRRQVSETGIAIVSQTQGLVPADRLLYALRDVTATVEQDSLIASSVMSKKIAAGATAVVLDVKVGGGAFLREVEQAREVARIMIDLGRDAGHDVRAVLTAMDEPLGLAVGNALEVREAFALLSGSGPADLREVVLTLAGHLLAMAGRDKTPSLGRERAAAHLENGTARETARRWVAAQGGRPDVVDGKDLPQAPFVLQVRSERTGWLQQVAARPIAEACLALGAGRESKGASVDASVGVVLAGGSGTEIAAGEVLASIHARTEQQARAVETLVRSAFTVGAEQPAARKTILEEIYEGVS